MAADRVRTALLAVVLAAGCGAPQTAAPPQAAAPAGAIGLASLDQAVFDELVRSGRWAEVIDPAVGVVEEHAMDSGADDDPGDHWVRRWCGDRALATVQTVAAAAQRRAIEAPDRYPIRCQAIGLTVACEQSAVENYEPSYIFGFGRRNNLYVLTWFSIDNYLPAGGESGDELDLQLSKSRGC